ncbi:Signal transduction histidine-protein kinase BarA [Methanoculleus chikugoensis]|jgi:two-component system sensor histidine kinase BarA|uniref:histidine kinase n=1 Tax=Methanoculleus chikugoensis TaxID=118126 RepID=A0A1M4MJ71_9EURY|nr:HAMP domain-containing sensor histidine kinase [Methanoculleus chikugoensis]MDD4566857.1 HAMP domain-containing sensor histidine kinase [Methanoculleus chikugoensis]SCL74964.1 Signal transduction histidine-protein kinase BarA [Methanoculleus chikugoensis]
MKSDRIPDPEDWPFVYLLIATILLIVITTIGLLAVHDYILAEERMASDLETLQDVTEKSVRESIVDVDTGLKLFDDSLNERMRDGFSLFLREYERAEGDPSRMDLSALKERLGGRIDLYVINESGVIEYTTYSPDQGLDFRNVPGFYDEITRMRLEGEFSPDRVVYEPATGQVRKYAYMPTPDHRYLLEIGLVPDAFVIERNRLRSQESMQEFVAMNPYLDSIRVYDIFGNPVGMADGPTDARTREFVTGTVIPGRTDHEVQDAERGKRIRYLFIDLKDPDYPSDPSVVVELTYDTGLVQNQLDRMLVERAAAASLAIALCSAVIFLAARRLTRPIEEIIDDVDIIAQGDLDHTVRVSATREVVRLERSINTMVASLKSGIQNLRKSEETIREYSEHLEEQVEARTAELKKSTEKANLYLDIMTHDIRNATNTASLYADLLMDELEGEQRSYTGKLRKSLRKNIEIIRNVNTIRQIQEEAVVLRPVALDPVIRAEIEHYPDVSITYAGTTATVLADDLLPEVFTNLIGNAEKFTGPGGQIAIRVEERGKEVEVSVEDDGPGIPDEKKPYLFTRFSGGDGEKGGRGLGLYICRMLIERYGGKIWADDRVAGRPEEGAAIRLILRKAA